MPSDDEQKAKENKACLYGAALEKVLQATPKSNFMVLGFGYRQVVVPYKDGVEIARHMQMAELYSASYGKPTKISPMNTDEGFSTKVLSHAEYTDIKVAGLLEITPEEVKTMRLASESLKKKDDDDAS